MGYGIDKARLHAYADGVNRRKFLKTSAIAAGGLWLTGCATTSRSRGRAFRFIHYTDSHIRPQFDVPLAVEQSLAKAASFRPDFLITGGDLITDGYTSDPPTSAERFDIFLERMNRYSFPAYHCIGNHDVVAVEPPDGTPKSSHPKAMFLSKLGMNRAYHSFDHEGWHFIILDSMQIENDRGLKYIGYIDADQIEWLDNDLKQVGAATPIVVVTHLPLLTVLYQREKGATEPAPADRIVVNGTDVIKLLAQYHTKLVLQGHLHICERIEYGGMTFITGGAVSGKWWRGSYYGYPEGFGVVSVRDGDFEYRYETYGWAAKRPPHL